MPVKWTSENDQLLLLKILETHDLAVDTKRVASAWPGDSNNKPTPRAITERLVRMRQIVKASSNGNEGHFSIGKGTATSAASTPRKPRLTPKSAASSGGKRKRFGNVDDSHLDLDSSPAVKMELGDDSDIEFDTPTKTGPLQLAFTALNHGHTPPRIGTSLKLEPKNDDPFMDVSPPKRVRKASELPPGMVNYEKDEEDKDDGMESSASEYQPEVIKLEQDGDNWA